MPSITVVGEAEAEAHPHIQVIADTMPLWSKVKYMIKYLDLKSYEPLALFEMLFLTAVDEAEAHTDHEPLSLFEMPCLTAVGDQTFGPDLTIVICERANHYGLIEVVLRDP